MKIKDLAFIERRLKAYKRLEKIDASTLSPDECAWSNKMRKMSYEADSMTLARWDGRLCFARLEKVGKPSENIVMCFMDGGHP